MSKYSFFYYHLYNDKDLTTMYSNNDLATVRKISPVTMNALPRNCLKCYTFTSCMLALVLY